MVWGIDEQWGKVKVMMVWGIDEQWGKVKVMMVWGIDVNEVVGDEWGIDEQGKQWRWWYEVLMNSEVKWRWWCMRYWWTVR